jgi:hypothetical protein
MSRRIVFAGGTQTRAIARIYRNEIAGETGDDVVFIGSGAAGTDAARSALFLADLIALEIDEDGDALPAGDIPTTADLVRIPNLYCDYLWPFAGRSHPKNRGNFILAGGPYPAEHGDRFLDQMVAEGIPEDDAIRRYLAMDIAKEGELDSRLEDRQAIQQRLDGVSGFDMAAFIADNFRTRPLFRTRQRMTRRPLRRLLSQLLPKLGVQGFDGDRIERVPFPAGAQPIHPGVAAHFGLRWVGHGQLFPVNQEGYFTFEAFCRRYMRFEWNEVLHRGIETARTRPADALADLERGLADSPESPLGRRALALARHAVGLQAEPPPPTILEEDSYDPAEDPLPEAQPAPAETAAPAAGVEAPPSESAAPTSEPMPAPFTEFPTRPTETDAAVAKVPEAEPEPGDLYAAAEEDALNALRTRIGSSPTPAPAVAAPARPASAPAIVQPAYDASEHGFTDFGAPSVKEKVEAKALSAPGSELIDVLPRLLPVFNDLSSAADRPFSAMPEIMPPPPLRPILPPELQNDPPKQGFLSRILGRKSAQ